MPPRIADFPCLQVLRSALLSTHARPVAGAPRLFSSTPSCDAPTKKRTNRYRDPYLISLARAKRAANVTKQAELTRSRARALGDPVRGTETEFVKSFDKARVVEGTQDLEKPMLNYFLNESEIAEQMEASKRLCLPILDKPATSLSQSTVTDSAQQAQLEEEKAQTQAEFEKAHETVQEALRRITNIDNGNAKDRHRVNILRCIETFGRHETDRTLPPRLRGMSVAEARGAEEVSAVRASERPPRKGPDTGSSEVQIAILTAKIRSLANHLDRAGSSDKVGKRDLRLLVHKRQKLLKYLRRSDRGGPRWQKCVETLGLTEGTWRGEISL